MNKKIYLALSSVAFALVGCGGGGGGTSSSPIVSTCTNGALDYPSCLVMPQANLISTVPQPTYAAGSIQAQALSDLNAIRQALGLGLVKQNVYLDTSAQNHTNYLQNFPTSGHGETAGTAGFTGALPTDRAKYAGYVSTLPVLEGIGGSYNTDVNGKYISSINSLMNSVYHRSSLLKQWITDIGFGTLTPVGSTTDTTFVTDYSAVTGQYNAPTFTMNYPIQGQTNVKTYMTPEDPNPAPSINAPGYPISFAAAAGTILNVTSFTLTQSGSSVPVSTSFINSTNGPYINLLEKNEASIVPNVPLLNSTTYTANITGTITYADGSHAIPLNTTWSFTTEPTGS